MSHPVQSWTCLAIWGVVSVVLVTTGIAGLLLAAMAAGCGGYRAYADGLVVRRPRR